MRAQIHTKRGRAISNKASGYPVRLSGEDVGRGTFYRHFHTLDELAKYDLPQRQVGTNVNTAPFTDFSGGGYFLPTAVSGGLAFTSVATGGGSACGLVASGAAYCWGWNEYGQLGTSAAPWRRAASHALVPTLGRRLFGSKRTGRMPNMIQAGTYSSTLQYLKVQQD